jgi:FlaA1/EpsC-like NDP-sugar epimerase
MSQSRTKTIVILVAGDLLVLLSFVLIGRQNHALAVTNIISTAQTAIPFLFSWFLIAPWFGLYKNEISSVFSKFLPRLLAVWLISIPVAHIIRALLLGRSIPGGIPITFVMVSLVYIGVVMLIWRSIYAWWHQRQAPGTKT